MFTLSCGFVFCRTWRWILAEEKMTQEHGSAATTTLMGMKTKASRRDQAGPEMLSGAFGRKGEDKVLGLFKQLQ